MDLNPYLQYGAFGLLSFIVVWAVRSVPPILQSFTTALSEQRGEFREERREERKFLQGELQQNRTSIGGLARAVDRQTVAIVASSKGADVDEALATHEQRNGHARSGGTYEGAP